jgi:hypothetical protein
MNKEDDDEKTTINSNYLWIVIIVIIALILWSNKDEADYRNGITKDYSVIRGQVFKYEESNHVEGSDIYLTYSYMVNGQEYFREINCEKMPSCIGADGQLTSNCRKKRFWVLYSNLDFSKSIINLKSIDKDTIHNINLDDFR